MLVQASSSEATSETTIAVWYAMRPSAVNATPGSLAAWKAPPVQAERAGTRTRENERPPSREAITVSVALPSWIQETRMCLGSVGLIATEVSCANPGLNPGFAKAQGADGENGLGGEIRCVSTLTDAASTGSAPAP